MQSIDTVDNISVNKQRQLPRTGTAQWQDLGDVICDATQVPMIQKMQKTVGILQIPHIDRVMNARRQSDAVQISRKVRTSVHKQVRRQVQRQDSR